MTPRTRNTGIAAAGAAALAFGAYALGSQSGDGSASANGSSSGQRSQTSAFVHREGRFGPRGRGPGSALGLDALAGKLGVTPSALRDALAAVRDELAPDQQDRHDQLATKLADALNLPADKVRAALDALHPEHAGRDGFAADLAKALGLDEAKVRAAFEKLRGQARPGNRADFAAALAKELGVSTDKLRSALQSLRPRDRGGRPGRHERPSLDALAGKLGVTTTQLRAAFDKLRADMQKEFNARRDAFVTALAKKLNLDKAKVEDALGSLPRPGFAPHGP